MSWPQGFAGVPAPLRHGEWLLVRWVATAAPGDAFPEPWRQSRDPFATMIGQLVGFGVMAAPPPDADIATTAREATAAARSWLDRHPQPPLVPQVLPRHMTVRPALAAGALNVLDERLAGAGVGAPGSLLSLARERERQVARAREAAAARDAGGDAPPATQSGPARE